MSVVQVELLTWREREISFEPLFVQPWKQLAELLPIHQADDRSQYSAFRRVSRVKKTAGVRGGGIAAHVEEPDAQIGKTLGGRVAPQFAPKPGRGSVGLVGIEKVRGALEDRKLNSHYREAARLGELRKPGDLLELNLAE